jgi:hypothetical protein
MTIEQIIEIPPDRRLVLNLPFELPVSRAKVELTVTPEKREIVVSEKAAFGCLQRFAESAKIPGEKGAWVQAVLEKYAKS